MIRTNLAVYHDCRNYSVQNYGYPIKIRLYHNKLHRYLKTGYYSDLNYYIHGNSDNNEFLNSLIKQKTIYVSKKHPQAKIINKGLQLKLNAAEKFIFNNQNNLVNYPIDRLKKIIQEVVDTLNSDIDLQQLFKRNSTLKEVFKKKITQLNANEQWGTKRTYQDSLSAFTRYLKHLRKSDVYLTDINKKWVASFDNWYKMQPGKNGNKVGLSSRKKKITQLKHLIQLACDDEEEIITWADYTFHKYKLPNSKSSKRSFEISKINREELSSRFDLDRVANVMDFMRQLRLVKNTPRWHYRNYALFMWDCRGMDLIDLAFLQRKSIVNNTLIYSRKKVVGNALASIDLNEEALEILDFYDYKKLKSNQLVFPFMRKEFDKNGGLTEQVYLLYKTRVKYFNEAITALMQSMGFNKATSKMIRHTWAQDGFKLFENRDLIGEGLIHSNSYTTRIYARELDRERIHEVNMVITERKSLITSMREDIVIDLFQLFHSGKLWDVEVNEFKSKVIVKLNSYRSRLFEILEKRQLKKWSQGLSDLDKLEFYSYKELEEWIDKKLKPILEKNDIRLITSDYNL